MRGRGQLSHFSGEGCASPHMWMRKSKLQGGRTAQVLSAGEGVASRQASHGSGPCALPEELGWGWGLWCPRASEHGRPFQLLWVGGRLGLGEGHLPLSSASCTLHSFMLLLQQISNLSLKTANRLQGRTLPAPSSLWGLQASLDVAVSLRSLPPFHALSLCLSAL